MTKLSKLLVVIAILLVTLSTLAAKDFAKEKIVISVCADKALEIAEAQALISYGAATRSMIRTEPSVNLVAQNDQKMTLTFLVKGIQANTAETSVCNYKVQMHRNTLGECWMEQIKQTECL